MWETVDPSQSEIIATFLVPAALFVGIIVGSVGAAVVRKASKVSLVDYMMLRGKSGHG